MIRPISFGGQLLLALAITGCQSGRQALPASLPSDQSQQANEASESQPWWQGSVAQLKKQAAGDLGCESIEVVEIGKFVAEAKGCDKQLVYAYDEPLKEWVSPLKRATYELSCPREELVGESLGGGNAGVSGCGHRVVYALIRGHADGRVQWIINSESELSKGKAPSEAKATGNVAGTK